MARNGRSKRPALQQGWALYLRTSDEEAQAPERSQASQRRLIRDHLVNPSTLPNLAEYADTYTGRADDRANYQQLLKDARLGKFSHVGIAFVDRFGRNDVEGIRAFDELNALGITVRIATYPSLDPTTPDGRMVVGILFTVARFESDRTGQRSKEGMLTKLLEGGWPFKAPDGYLNRETKINQSNSIADRLNNARYKRWVELDPEQAKVWRYAWDLLLEDKHSLAEICETLHQRGYKLKSGALFVRLTPSGMRRPNVGAVSRIFHNWFYAGWAVLDSDLGTVPPKTVRGTWEALVSTEEFERGLAILEHRNQVPERKKKHFYLLQRLVYLQLKDGKEERLICSTPNANRQRGGVAYYCIQSSRYNFLCYQVDGQIPGLMNTIQVDRALTPALRQAYIEDIDQFISKPMVDRAALEKALNDITDEETKVLGLFTAGRISDEAWDRKCREWRDRRASIRISLDGIDRSRAAHISNLDAALNLITKIGILYARLDPYQQQHVLNQVIKRVVINTEGMIVRVDLRSPFAYLHHKVSGSGSLLAGNTSSNRDEVGNKKTSTLADTGSFIFSFSVPSRTRTCASGSGGQRSIL